MNEKHQTNEIIKTLEGGYEIMGYGDEHYLENIDNDVLKGKEGNENFVNEAISQGTYEKRFMEWRMQKKIWKPSELRFGGNGKFKENGRRAVSNNRLKPLQYPDQK
ncbi:hypothetical protein Tco_0089988 [Tanacetum coccineum]